MKTINKSMQRILLVLLKSISQIHTATSLAKELHISRWGAWKILKNLESQEFVIIDTLGSAKTSTKIIKLNWNNSFLQKTLVFILAQEAIQQKRWQWEFKELEKHDNFTILYGSILNSPKKANDIDIINIISKKNSFIEVDNILKEKQVIQLKKIHDINFTPKEFKTELKRPNKAFIHAVKTGIVLYGQEKFVNFIKGLA